MLETVVGIIGAALLATIGWAFTLSNRVAVLEADKVSLRQLVDERFASMMELIKERLETLSSRLARIEAKLDHDSK